MTTTNNIPALPIDLIRYQTEKWNDKLRSIGVDKILTPEEQLIRILQDDGINKQAAKREIL